MTAATSAASISIAGGDYCRRGYTTSYSSNPPKHFIVAVASLPNPQHESGTIATRVNRRRSHIPCHPPSYTSPLLQPAPPPHHIQLKSLKMLICFCGPSYSLRKLPRVVHLMQCTKPSGTSPTTSHLDNTSDSPPNGVSATTTQ